MAINPFPELQTVVVYCRSYESSAKDSSTLPQGNIAKITNKRNNSSNSYKSECCFYCRKGRQSKCNTCGKTGHWQTVCGQKIYKNREIKAIDHIYTARVHNNSTRTTKNKSETPIPRQLNPGAC